MKDCEQIITIGTYMKKIKEYLLITLGVIFIAASIQFFMAPNKIAAGGVSGASIIINFLFPSLSIGLLMLLMNSVLFIIAFVVIGSRFGGKTLYSSLSLSGLIWAMDRFLPKGVAVTNNLMLASIFGTLISGVGMAIVFNQNASTGGTDILAKILNKFVHLDIGKSLLAVDFIITLFCGFLIGADIGMYALLSVIINGFVIDSLIDGMNVCKQITIISKKNNLINKFISETLNRGCTLFQGVGGYTGTNSLVLYTVLSRREFIKLKKYIKEIDERAFIIVSEAHEVLGEGFKDILDF